MNRGPIHVHIDELVLDGFDPSQRHEIADTLQHELTALLADEMVEGLRPSSLRLERADAGAFLVAKHTGSNLGRQIAKAVGAEVSTTLRGAPAAGQSLRIR